jgi:3-oxoacyl-ACP reductase-like protein
MTRAVPIVLALSVAFLASSTASAQQKQAAPAQKPAAAPPAAKPAVAPAAKKWKEPVKGTAVIQVLKPVVKVQGGDVVTKITIKNISYGPIGGLRIDEYWYDKGGELVGGGTERLKRLFLPEEVITLELRSPKNAKMDRNSYQFSHANGKVKAEMVRKFQE